MKLVRFERCDNGSISLGLLDGDIVRSFEGSGLPQEMRKILSLLPEHAAAITKAVSKSNIYYPVSAVKLLAPIADPEKILCIGLNYKDHAEESKMPIPQRPVVFSKYTSAIIGPNDTIRLPPNSDEIDYEVELVIVIGKGGRHISKENAMQHVAGFTVGNDVSARDWQLKKGGGQWMIGKTNDTFAPIGPCIRVNDGQFDPHSARLWTIVNGRKLQNSNTNQLIFKTEELVAHLSAFLELKPGDIVFTGTPPGVGMARKPPVWLRNGDEVTVALEGIGELSNACTSDPRPGQEAVIVTGGSGMIGAWVAKILLEQGAHVTLFDVREDNSLLRQVLTPQQMRSVRKVYGDIGELDVMLKIVQEIRPTYILHLAALQVPYCQADPTLGARVNVVGTVNVFEAAKRFGKIPVIYASSGAVAGDASAYTQHPLPDDIYHKPSVHYGVYKIANEGTARVYWKHSQVPSVGLRPMTVFGVGRERGMTSFPTRAIKAMVNGAKSYGVPFSGPTGFSYVEDIAKMFVLCAEQVRQQTDAFVFNVRGHVVDVEKFIAAVYTVLPQSKGCITIKGKSLAFDPDTDDSGLRHFLGNKFPDRSLESAIEETVKIFQRNKQAGIWHTADIDEDPFAPPKPLLPVSKL